MKTAGFPVLEGRLENFAFLLFNPLNPELNFICYLLALLAHDFLHVSRIRVNLCPKLRCGEEYLELRGMR
jgi:hypothetical protein